MIDTNKQILRQHQLHKIVAMYTFILSTVTNKLSSNDQAIDKT